MWSKLFAIDGTHIANSIRGNILLSLREVFPASGVDIVNNTLDGNAISPEDFRYQTYWQTLLLAMLGLQTRQAHLQTNTDRYLLLPLSVLSLPLTTPLHVLKMATEFLPLLLCKLVIMAGLHIETKDKRAHMPSYDGASAAHPWLKNGWNVLWCYGLFVPFVMLMLAHWIGRSATSPIENVQHFWKISENTWLDPASNVALALFGLSLTLSVYGLSWYFAPIIFANSLVPFIAHLIPGFVTQALHVTVMALSPLLEFIAPITTLIISAYVSALTLHFIQIAPLLSTAPLTIGACTLFTLGLGTVGTAVNAGLQRFERWLHTPPEDGVAGKPVMEETTALIPNSQTTMRRSLAPMPARNPSSVVYDLIPPTRSTDNKPVPGSPITEPIEPIYKRYSLN